MPSKSFGQQQPVGGIPPVRSAAVDQGLRRQDSALDLVRACQRHRARETCRRQQTLGVVGGPGGVDVNRRSMGFDDNGSPVLQFDLPDDVDAPGAEANFSDRAAQPISYPAVQERPQLPRRHSTVNGALGVSDGLGQRGRASRNVGGLHAQSMRLDHLSPPTSPATSTSVGADKSGWVLRRRCT